MFISPGLYRNEKRYVFPFMFSTVLLFPREGPCVQNGLPGGVELPNRLRQQFQPMIRLASTRTCSLPLWFGMGVIFELPFWCFSLALMGIVNAGLDVAKTSLFDSGDLLSCGHITPTTRHLNMCIFAARWWGCTILSIGIAWMVHPKQRKARQARKDQ